MIRVLLAEDQAMMRGALSVLLGLEPDLEVVGEVGAAGDIVAAAVRLRPDVALLDIEFADGSALDVAPQLHALVPRCAIAFVTTFGRPGYLRRAFDAGARGFLVKDGPVDGLASAVRTLHAGGTVVDPALAAAALTAGPSPLTGRERDVLVTSADGRSSQEIGVTLHLSESTVRNYLSAAIAKTGTRNRVEALATAREQGWV